MKKIEDCKPVYDQSIINQTTWEKDWQEDIFELDDQERINVQAEIESLLLSVKRDGMEELVDWLKNSTYFIDPASANYHLNCDGGLAWHSLSVYKTLRKLIATGLYGDVASDTIIITALLHDVCKVGTYEKVPKTNTYFSTDKTKRHYVTFEGYVNKDDFPFGHGEKSVTLIQDFIKLTEEEKLMIRYHMGAFNVDEQNNYSKSCSMYPSVLALQEADMTSSSVIEAQLCSK